MYIGRDFPGFENQTARILGFDLANLLRDHEEISSITSRLRVANPETDPLPAEHLPLAPQFSGSMVNQMVSFNDPANYFLGNVYALSFNVTTNQRILTPWARFRILPGYGVSTYPAEPAPATAMSLLLPASFYDFVVPTLTGGYTGVDFPTANQSEQLYYGFNFTPAMSPGETIETATSYLALFSGIDNAVLNDPEVYDSGSPVISGPIVAQKLAWPGGSTLTANVYVLQITAVTSYNQSLGAKARITVGKVE